MNAELRTRAEQGRAWLFEQALPLWAERGLNPRGGFYDRLGEDRLAVTPAPMRLRVQARQLYVFAEAGRLGWSGPWRPVVEHGLAFLLHRATTDSGLVAHTFDDDGGVVENGPDLYDQAFALLGFAHAYAALEDPRARAAALDLRDALQPFAHPLGGFREPAAEGLGANPHMHLFEALLAWEKLDEDPSWSRLADQVATLCADRMIDAESSALREHFTGDWSPAAGARGDETEPGHHYEWAWLLRRSGRPEGAAAEALCKRAEHLGVDRARRVAINAVSVAGDRLDATARLWPQTERLKAMLSLGWAEPAAEAFDALFAYIQPAPAGLWYDLMQEDGRVRAEPAPASSFYHIVGALSELFRETGPW